MQWISPHQLHIALKPKSMFAFFSTKLTIYWRHISSFNLGHECLKKIAIAIGFSSLAALPLMSGPVVKVKVPAPVVTVAVSDNYVWTVTNMSVSSALNITPHSQTSARLSVCIQY